ncbi:MAG TPA: right-handed parallel beta-helix repeat-containing protein, partial [Planctomycetota bacterium]|nr:right-handed parallel beta-helix repeat-containing protein [Planctomycetota bacterium]
TVTFADAKYEHVPNYGFEEGLAGWDVTKARGAKVVSSMIRPMVGAKILELKAGDEIVSPYITLPVPDRTYYAMCAVATDKMRVTINVDDAQGNPVTCTFTGRREPVSQPPLANQNPKLGGGVLFAHLHHLPAGKYRIRIKAETDCLIDECDIRPGLDAGVAVVGRIAPYATYSDALKWYPCAFFDYNRKDAREQAVEGIPVVTGAGTVTIRNGVIRNGTPGMRTLGVHSNAPEVTVVLKNVKIVNSGINANAARLSRATLQDCRLEVDTPFIIDRHNTTEASVRVDHATEISGCEFIGGQGNFSGECPSIHDNLFVNAQTVTNHYSISPGSGTKIYRNRFEPRIGSGIYIGRGHDVEVYDNVFKIASAPPNCEYRYSRYSTNAIRLSDYNAKPGEPAERRCAGNRVYNNTIHITGKSYPEYDHYEPRAYAFFISVGGGTNTIHGNRIFIDKTDRGNCRALAFFVGGSSNGGEIHNNTVVSNCPVGWLGNDYGNAANTVFHGNRFERAPNTPRGTKLFVLGDGGNAVRDVGFYSNDFDGWTELFDYHSRSVAYAFGWTLTVKVVDGAGRARADAEVVITAADGAEVLRRRTDGAGQAEIRLPEFTYENGRQVDCPAYTVTCGGASTKADLKKDTAVTLRVE